MDDCAYHHYDTSGRAWEILEPLIPGCPGKVGRPTRNNPRFSNAVLRVSRCRRTLAPPAPGLRTLGFYLQSLP